jgi:hypothetical protein
VILAAQMGDGPGRCRWRRVTAVPDGVAGCRTGDTGVVQGAGDARDAVPVRALGEDPGSAPGPAMASAPSSPPRTPGSRRRKARRVRRRSSRDPLSREAVKSALRCPPVTHCERVGDPDCELRGRCRYYPARPERPAQSVESEELEIESLPDGEQQRPEQGGVKGRRVEPERARTRVGEQVPVLSAERTFLSGPPNSSASARAKSRITAPSR